MYLTLGLFKISCSAVVYDFTISIANLVLNPAIILSNEKSIARVHLLLTCCNCTISIGCHSSYLIQFVGWFSFNLNKNSCNICGKSQKNTSCKSLNIYLSRYLCGVNLWFLLSFYANSSSLVLNHISISSFVVFHGLNIPFYVFILRVFLQHISATQSCAVPTINETICWMLGLTQVSISIGFQKNPQNYRRSW
jgi:hypothetical protein